MAKANKDNTVYSILTEEQILDNLLNTSNISFNQEDMNFEKYSHYFRKTYKTRKNI